MHITFESTLGIFIQTNVVIKYYLDTESSVLAPLCLSGHGRFPRGMPHVIFNCHLQPSVDCIQRV